MAGRGPQRRRPPLERMFGVFRCKCHKDATWASAHVYCVEGTLRVYYRQMCQRCRTAINPFIVRHLECSLCQQPVPECECERNEQAEDRTRPAHRSDLCLKCRSGWPCSRNSN